MTGAIDTFTTETEAKHGLIQQAQKWSMIGSVLKKLPLLNALPIEGIFWRDTARPIFSH
jgi:hypothetical protein